jgi:two-component system, LytTR family, response regulator
MTSNLEQEPLSELAGADLARLADNANTQPKSWDEFIGPSDFAFFEDEAKCWMIRPADISTLEACGNYTRVHLGFATPLIRRPLRECERKLDPSLFFRARRDCIVNLGIVSQTRLLVPFRLVFMLQDSREIVASHKQSLILRRSRGL